MRMIYKPSLEVLLSSWGYLLIVLTQKLGPGGIREKNRSELRLEESATQNQN
jgi:hypothetical protein